MKSPDSTETEPLDVNQAIFEAKFNGVIQGIAKSLKEKLPDKVLELLIDNKSDLGLSWERLFLTYFDYQGGIYYQDKKNNSPTKETVFFRALDLLEKGQNRTIPINIKDSFKLLLYIVENSSIEFAYQPKYLNSTSSDFLPLAVVAEINEDIALVILKRLDPARKDQDLPMYRAALANAQKQNFRKLITAIEDRIDYQPPAAVTQIAKKSDSIIALSDPRDAIENAIRSGNLSAALRVDDQILRECTQFFERFQNLYTQTLSHADDANKAREALDKRIERLQSSLKTLMDEMDPNTRYESIGQELWIATRNIIPWLNPRRALENTNIEVTSSIDAALRQSYQLIDDCQSFAEAAPKVLEELQKLKASYAEALTKIDNELSNDLSDDQRRLKSQLRSIFSKAHERINIMAGTLVIQDLANPALVATELEFVSGLKDLMVSFSASATTAINSMALMKMGMTDDMRGRILDSLAQQWDQADKTMRLLRQHGDVKIPQITHQPSNGVPLSQGSLRAENLLAPVT
jgi:hypothetical protein